MRGANERRVGGQCLRSWPLLVCADALVNRREGGSVLREHVVQYGERELTKNPVYWFKFVHEDFGGLY